MAAVSAGSAQDLLTGYTAYTDAAEIAATTAAHNAMLPTTVTIISTSYVTTTATTV
jgi:hypothetical protein